jgi:Putative Ig domain/IPT/TIG domain
MRGTLAKSGSDWSARRVGALLAGTGCAAGLVLVAAPAAYALPTGCTQTAETVTCAYSATGSEQTFTPPTGITTLTVTLSGGGGGAGLTVGLTSGGVGGAGATVSGTLTGVTGPLNVWAGAQGTTATLAGNSAGGSGYGAGGNGVTHTSGGGGGGSAILNGTTALVVAAGGGGGGGGVALNRVGGAGGAAGSNGAHGTIGSGMVGSGGTAGSAGSSAGGAGGAGTPGGGGGGGGNAGGSGGHAGVVSIIPPAAIGGGGGGGGTNLLASGTSVTSTSNTGDGSVSISYTLPPLAITTTSLPAASVGVAYSATLNATGATPPYGWAITSGSLPPGLSLDGTTGVISGTPTTAGNYYFTVTATDSATPASSVSVSLSISVGPVVSSVYTNYGLPGGGQITRIYGAGLDCSGCTVSVKFGNARATVLFATPTELTVTAPPGHGTVNVTVTVNGVTSATSSADTYTYY